MGQERSGSKRVGINEPETAYFEQELDGDASPSAGLSLEEQPDAVRIELHRPSLDDVFFALTGDAAASSRETAGAAR